MLFKRLLHSCLLIGITAGSLYAGGGDPSANHYPLNTVNPPYWIDVVITDVPLYGDASICLRNEYSVINVVQRDALISLFAAQDNNGYNRVALPYDEPVWVYGIPTDQGGAGCTVSPGHTLRITYQYPSGVFTGDGGCRLYCR